MSRFNFFSIISISKSPRSKIQSVNLWIGLVWITCIFFLVALIGSWKTAITWTSYVYSEIILVLEKNKNTRLKIDVLNMEKVTQVLNKKMDSWFELEDNMRLMYNMNPITKDERNLGVGGKSSLADSYLKQKGSTGLRLYNLSNNLDLLLRQSELEINQFDAIRENIYKKNSYWLHKPTIWPCMGRITSEFGFRIHPIDKNPSMHEGLDIACAYGTPVKAPANAQVIFSGISDRYGNLLILDHGYNFKTYYGHLRKYIVKEGQMVRRGELIGYVGMTGMATGPHLHYEVRINNNNVNPHQNIITENCVVD